MDLDLRDSTLFVNQQGNIGQSGPSVTHFRRTEKDCQVRICDAEPLQGNHDRVIPHQTGRKGDGYRQFARDCPLTGASRAFVRPDGA
jgi:hypothetical protein